MSKPNHIAIFAAADEGYAIPMATMMSSVLINHKGEMPITFYLSGDDIGAESKERLQSLAESHSAAVEWVNISAADAETLRESTRVSPKLRSLSSHAFDRLLMPRLLPEDLERVIYLDADLVVSGDIEELWNLPLGDYPILATQEYSIPTAADVCNIANIQTLSEPDFTHIFAVMGLEPDTKYFNSGVMLVNLNAWREKDITSQLLTCLSHHIQKCILWDQDILNAVLAKQWGELSPQWNSVTHLHEAGSWRESESPYTEEAFNAALDNPKIIHFSTSRKPWKFGCAHPAKDLYFEYLDKTPWKEWRPEPTAAEGEVRSKRVLITGGAGFIGSHLVNRFIAKGWQVVVLDSLEETSDLTRIDEAVHTIIKDRMENVSALPTVDLVINAAAEAHVDYSFERPQDFINTNIIGLHNLAKHCSENYIPIIHLSTDEVIGTGEDLYESSMLKPTNPYSFTKCAGENLLHAYGYSYGLDWKIVRLNNTYGKKQFPDKLIPKFIKSINNNEKLTIHGDGSVQRNFLHVDDFVDAVEVVYAKGENRNIYNVSTDEEYTIMRVTEMICDAMNVNVADVVEYVEDRPFNDPCYHSMSDKLRKLNWVPKRNLKDSLPELVEYYSNKEKAVSLKAYRDSRLEKSFEKENAFLDEKVAIA